MSIVREIREIQGRVGKCEQQIAKLPTRISNMVGGSGTASSSESTGDGTGIFSVPTVLVLPEVVSGGEFMRIVYWTSLGAGTGDDQLWVCYAGQSKWTPMQKFTSNSGVPV